MATGITGRLVRRTTKEPLQGITIEAVNASTGVSASTTTTTDTKGFFELNGLTSAVYFAKPLVSGDDWDLLPNIAEIYTDEIHVASSLALDGPISLASATQNIISINDTTGSEAMFIAQSTGDPEFKWVAAGAWQYVLGIDNSVSGDPLILAAKNNSEPTLGTDDILSISNTADVAAGGFIKSSHATGGIGYATGAGGTVTQLTSKTTGVTLNNICGTVVTHNAALGSGASAVWLVTNSAIGANDVVILNFQDTAASTANAYTVEVAQIVAGGFNIRLTNTTGGSLSEAVTINFAVIKAVAA